MDKTELSPMQLTILTLTAQGFGDKEIASKMDRAVETIKTHHIAIRWKLGANNRTEAVAIAIRRGLI